MFVRPRPLPALILSAFLAACSTPPTEPLGDLPRPPQASLEQLLEQAANSNPEQAALLYLSAADLAYKQGHSDKARAILSPLSIASLKPAQQVFARTLQAEMLLAERKPQEALSQLQDPSMDILASLPVEQQVRSEVARARALQGSGQPLAAARERVFIAPLLSGAAAADNQEAIWKLVSRLPIEQLQGASEPDLAGWLELAKLSKSASTPSQQWAAIEQWQASNPNHPAAKQLPKALEQIKAMASQPLTKIAVLLPEQGPLTSAGNALRQGLMAAQLSSQGSDQPVELSFFDSTQIGSIDAFYRQAQASGIQLVIGPLEKPLVKQLAQRQQLPITTLALNYSEARQSGPAQLFEFGLSAEDEAREVTRRAQADGMHRAIAIVPPGDWGNRVLEAFQQSWQSAGGELVGTLRIGQPVELAQQIGGLLKPRGDEAPSADGQPAKRRQDVDFVFLAANLQQARQIKPTLAFHYAGDLPVYSTSQLHSAGNNQALDMDLNGIRFCDTPWLLGGNDPLYQPVVAQWPQAASTLGNLVAMGIDAYRLAPRLSQLKVMPDTTIDGASGILSLNAQQKVQRQLPWAEYQNGQVQPLPEPSL